MARSNLRNLSSTGTIVLFTPVITPAHSAKASNQSNNNVDPFETLGRALSRHHKRIRHVPYLPPVGFTETHDAFISQADAVLVVICESSSGNHETLSEQAAFAEAAQECMETNDIGRADENEVILIQCGDQNAQHWPDLSQFGSTIKSRCYNVTAAQEIAQKLFEPTK